MKTEIKYELCSVKSWLNCSNIWQVYVFIPVYFFVNSLMNVWALYLNIVLDKILNTSMWNQTDFTYFLLSEYVCTFQVHMLICKIILCWHPKYSWIFWYHRLSNPTTLHKLLILLIWFWIVVLISNPLVWKRFLCTTYIIVMSRVITS